MNEAKFNFLKTEQFLLLNKLTENAKGKWGVMNAQQMVEHLGDFFNVSIEKIKVALVTPEEHLPKYREFMYSDKEFRENTKAPASILGEEALPLRYPSLIIAKEKLQQTVENFIIFFKDEPARKTLHPVFGMLDFDEWILLHYKHVLHHLKQFDLIEEKI